MGLFSRTPLDRSDLIAKAEKARSHGRRGKAIRLYQKALALKDEPVVHGKLAPLLAREHRRDESLQSFIAAAEGQVKAGFVDRALSLFTQASDFFPDRVDLWDRIAALHFERARRADAFLALVRGGGALEKKRPKEAVRLLRRALELTPSHQGATLLLARSLRRTGERGEAFDLLERLADKASGTLLRQARVLQLRIRPGLATLRHAVRAAILER